MKTMKVTLIKVACDEVEKTINEHYGFDDYCIAAAEEIGNGVSLEWGITGKISDYDAEEIADRTEKYNTHIYMNDLARQGIIEKGTYLIDVSW